MCKFAKIASKIGLIAVLLSIIVMVSGWLMTDIKVCVVAMVLMCIAAISFILCMVCNSVHASKENTTTT
ncbi:MAG: hypothetical protein RBR87_07925 [Bacteroidales bacterium]|jgi:hypothetical protein|nr:hypothetical protein [Bacteroidales bacterium]